MPDLVLIRHGQSQWNLENRFTGWTDVDLSPAGEEEARRAGRLLKAAGFRPAAAHTSLLKRAIRTLWLVLEEMDLVWLPVHRSWRLNERHYGALQGLNKAETARLHGDEQVRIWRRSFDLRPPALTPDDPRWPGRDPRYADLKPGQVPLAESLADTLARVRPYWQNVLEPELSAGRSLLVAAHGNSLRALIKHLEHISDQEIVGLEIPTGAPLVYDLDENLAVRGRRYLAE